MSLPIGLFFIAMVGFMTFQYSLDLCPGHCSLFNFFLIDWLFPRRDFA
jgi:hypothetical protein